MSTFNYLDLKTNTDTSNSSRPLKAGCEEPHSGVLWVGRWSSGDVEFYSQKQQSDMGGGERGVMQFLLILLLQTTGYRTGERGQKE